MTLREHYGPWAVVLGGSEGIKALVRTPARRRWCQCRARHRATPIRSHATADEARGLGADARTARARPHCRHRDRRHRRGHRGPRRRPRRATTRARCTRATACSIIPSTSRSTSWGSTGGAGAGVAPLRHAHGRAGPGRPDVRGSMSRVCAHPAPSPTRRRRRRAGVGRGMWLSCTNKGVDGARVDHGRHPHTDVERSGCRVELFDSMDRTTSHVRASSTSPTDRGGCRRSSTASSSSCAPCRGGGGGTHDPPAIGSIWGVDEPESSTWTG